MLTETKKAILKMLCGFGVTSITASFDGGGDSGQVNEITYVTTHGHNDHVRSLQLPSEVIEVVRADLKKRVKEDPHIYIDRNESWSKSVDDLVEYMVYDALEQSPGDWINNDGGFGEVYITPSEGRIYVDMNYRETIYSNAPYDLSIAESEIDWAEPVTPSEGANG